MQYSRSMTRGIYAIVLLFPVLSNLFQHACTVMVLLLTLFGLRLCYPAQNRPAVSRGEKMVLWAFAAYFFMYWLSFVINGVMGNLADPRIKYVEHQFRMLFIIPVFFLFRTIRLPVRLLWQSSVLGALISGIYAIGFGLILYPGERVYGSYHAIAFGGISLVTAFFSLAGIHAFQQQKRVLGRMIPWAGFVLGLGASILSGTRGAWIAVPVLLLIALVQYYRDLRPRTWMGIAAGILVAAVVLYQVPQTGIRMRVQQIYTEIAAYDGRNSKAGSATERLEGWKAAWNIFQEHPIIGAGPGNFKSLSHRMIDQGERSEIIRIYHQPHSAYLSVMADCGILSLLSLLAIFLVPAGVIIRQIRRMPAVRDAGFAGLYLIAAFMQFGLTETIFGQNLYIGFYVVMTAVVLSICGQDPSTDPKNTVLDHPASPSSS